MGLEDWVSDRDGERKRDYSSQHPYLDKTHFYKQWLPCRDLSEQLTHLQRLAGSPVWTGSLTGSSSHLKSPTNGTYLLCSPFNDPGQEGKQVWSPTQLLSVPFNLILQEVSPEMTSNLRVHLMGHQGREANQQPYSTFEHNLQMGSTGKIRARC